MFIDDDGIDAFSQRCDAICYNLPNALDIGFVAQREAFEINEEMIGRLIVGKALFDGIESICSRNPIGSAANIRGSISLGSFGINGLKSIFARMSRWRSTPGAISVNSSPSLVKRNTQRSVI